MLLRERRERHNRNRIHSAAIKMRVLQSEDSGPVIAYGSIRTNISIVRRSVSSPAMRESIKDGVERVDGVERFCIPFAGSPRLTSTQSRPCSGLANNPD